MNPRGWSRDRVTATVIGVALMGGGLGVGAKPIFDAYTRSHSEAALVNTWKGAVPAGNQLAGDVGSAGPSKPHSTSPEVKDAPKPCNAGGDATSAFALVTFPSLAQYGYAGVAGDGNWDLLHQQSMVHWHDSPAAGGTGNVIIAFHREPRYEHIDQLKAGDTVDVQDRACHTFTYRITQGWNLDPAKVTQLVPTSGHDLTLITCTPFWRDTNRLVWRGSLVAEDGKAVAGA